jgi:magnesium-transporting ATPase (P-type)
MNYYSPYQHRRKRPEKPPERRRGKDPLSQRLRWVSLIGWTLLISSIILIDFAKPEYVTLFDFRSNTPIDRRTTWNMTLINMIVFFQVCSFFLGSIGFVQSLKRTKRITDRYRFNLLLMALISFFGLWYYAIFF